MNIDRLKNILCLYFIILISFTIIAKENKHFTIVIPSFNNSTLYKENLDSVFCQNYEHYDVIYIDDCSNDNTAQLVEEYIKKQKQEKRCTLIKNQKRVGALENLWRSIHTCDPHHIIITLDGDDTLAHDHVLEYLNMVYQDPNIWLTYGQFSLKSNGARGWCTKMPDHIIKEGKFRTFPHLPGHLRTFYAWLFQEIKLEDLIMHRGFYPMTWDIAMMMPMIEMAGNRHTYIDEILYIYNDTTPINDDKINKQLQSYLSRVLRAKKPYKKLEKSILETEKNDNTSIVILSQENPMQLLSCLESIFLYVKNIQNVHVIYRSYDNITEKGYTYIKEKYPHVTFKKIDIRHNNIKEILSDVLHSIQSDFTIFTTDKMIVINHINVMQCAKAMRKTHAYAFHFRLGNNINQIFPSNVSIEIPYFITIFPTIFAWNFQYADTDWAYASNLDFTLYFTDELRKVCNTLMFHDIDSLEIQWANVTDIDHVGLCYKKVCAKRVYWMKNNNLGKIEPYTYAELTNFFAQGFKINVKKLSKKNIPTSRIEQVPQFIRRI